MLWCISCMNSRKCTRRLRSAGTVEQSKNVSISSDLPQPVPPYMYSPRGTLTAASSASSTASPPPPPPPPRPPPPPPLPNMLLRELPSDDHSPCSAALVPLAAPVKAVPLPGVWPLSGSGGGGGGG